MDDQICEVNVSRETTEALEAFGALVLKWTNRINLIGASTTADIWDRHIVDSIQIYRLVPSQFSIWLDIGSGGGFPGIVAAIIAKQHHPQASFLLIESDQRKATFLRTAIRELGLSAKVLADRIEQVPPIQADIISARALGALPQLLPLLSHHLQPRGCALLHKGKQAAAEIADARLGWCFDLEEYPSFTDPSAKLLLMKRISRLA